MTTVTLNPGYFSSRSALDWGFALLALLGTVFAHIFSPVGQSISGFLWFGAI